MDVDPIEVLDAINRLPAAGSAFPAGRDRQMKPRVGF
jgi:hypothetical protein